MGGTPSTTNDALETFDSIATDVALSKLLPIAERAVESAAEAAEPWLLTPGLKQIFEGLTDEAMGIAAKDLLILFVQSGVKIIITIQTEEEKSVYAAAEGALRSALLTKDAAKIAAARKVFNDAADSIIHSDGWLSTHHE